MTHYHPVSYEIEARIRQGEKLEQACRHRQVQAARIVWERSVPDVSLLSRVRRAVAAVVTMAGGLRRMALATEQER